MNKNNNTCKENLAERLTLKHNIRSKEIVVSARKRKIIKICSHEFEN